VGEKVISAGKWLCHSFQRALVQEVYHLSFCNNILIIITRTIYLRNKFYTTQCDVRLLLSDGRSYDCQ